MSKKKKCSHIKVGAGASDKTVPSEKTVGASVRMCPHGIGPLDVDRFHGNSQHIFWVYPPEKDLVTFRHDTHAAADFFCHNVITAASKNYVRMV